MKIAVLIPCYNEATTIGTVIADFRAALPEAEIFVYDNNSRDGTAEAARAAGVKPRLEPLQGKGNVVRRMFADIEADVYLLVDGNTTYTRRVRGKWWKSSSPSASTWSWGGAVAEADAGAYRTGHEFGNDLLTWVVTSTRRRLGDMP